MSSPESQLLTLCAKVGLNFPLPLHCFDQTSGDAKMAQNPLHTDAAAVSFETCSYLPETEFVPCGQFHSL